MEFHNVYEDTRRAEAYAKLEFPGTYYLAYRDLPGIIAHHVPGRKALDFGCGTGRSSRFLKKHGFDVTGIDISIDMIRKAKEIDPDGDYIRVDDGDFNHLRKKSFDLILSVFTFDNIPTFERKVKLLRELGALLREGGKIINLVSSPDIYTHEWASFTTKDFPDNRSAKTGDRVKIIMTDVEDRRPVEDIIWFPDAYSDVFSRAGFTTEGVYKPLGLSSEPYPWVNETVIAPWVIYALAGEGR